MSVLLKEERQDGLTLAVATALIPATWVFMGWSWGRSVAGHDGLAQTLPLLRKLSEAGGDWSALAYRPDLLGGAQVRDVVGPFPLFSVLLGLGFSPTAVLNLTIFLLQVLVAFLGLRTGEDLARGWRPEARRSGWAVRVAGVWLCAFAPALAWRFGYGHAALVVGALPLLAGLALLAAAAAGRITVTLLASAAAALCLALLCTAQQTFFCGAFFGAPLLLCAWRSLGGGVRPLAAGLTVAIGSLLLVLPGFSGMVTHAFSSDAPRMLGQESVTYSFLTSNFTDWLSSIPWTRSAVPASRQEMFHHEVNYPVGPLLVLLALAPWRRVRMLVAGAAVGLALAVAFSMDLRPVSSGLLALVPPLHYFRVPARAALPLLLVLPALALAVGLSSRAPEPESGRPGGSELVALPLGILVVLLPSLGRELLAWSLALGAVFLKRHPAASLAWLTPRVVLVVLGVASVSAFRERLRPLQDGEALLREAASIGDAVRKTRPETASPLSRVRLDLEIPAFTVNTAFAAGLSSLDGYHTPTRRFAALLFALRGVRYEPSAVFFKLSPEEPAFAVLRPLYNVGAQARLVARGRLEIAPLGPTAGAAWFSSSVAREESFESLARRLLAEKAELPRRALETLRVVAGDSFVAAAALPPQLDPACRGAAVTDVRAEGRKVVARVQAPAACPLTFAMSFVEALRVTIVSDGGRKEAGRVFPAFGALLGAFVPMGATEVAIEPAAAGPAWGPLPVVLGLGVLAGGAFVFASRGNGHSAGRSTAARRRR